MKLFARSLTLVLLLGMITVTAIAQEKSVALTPVSRDNEEWWPKRHHEKVELMKKGDIDFLMIGDSITHGWENQKDVWNKYYANRKVLNYGFSGDRTEHVLWRLQNSPLEAINPKLITIMIGTNNIGHNSTSPREAAEGILAIVDLLQEKYPDTKIFVQYVFPRDEKPDGKYRKQVNEINSYLPELLGKHKNVTLVDIGYLFLEEEGTLPKSIMPDSLHPNTEGYKIWAGALEPMVKPFFE